MNELDSDSSPSSSSATRLDRWRRRLLDLSLRNRLLNYRATKKTLPLLCPDLGRLEDLIADGRKFRILPHPQAPPPATALSSAQTSEAAQTSETPQAQVAEPLSDEPLSDEPLSDESLSDRYFLKELEEGRLYVDLDEEELDKRQVAIYRAARLALEEGGASTLYLATAFLVWYEDTRSDKPRLAPILLLPLEIRRRSIREGVTIVVGDEEPRVNVTLLEMLRQDFGLVIEGLDPLPEDDSGVDVGRVLDVFREGVRGVDRWHVREVAAVGLFSFHKFLMWRDLEAHAPMLLSSPVVRHLVERPREPFASDGAFPHPEQLDDERAPRETFCPLSADSSQLAAVFAAADGRSFVLEGPPGTGKSQTIANLIAHCLAVGKTVLFVSEKMAALHVVRKRLVRVGLGRSCLELHSDKTHKRAVLAQFERSLEFIESRAADAWEREAQTLGELRGDLNDLVRALHRPRALGCSVFQAISRLVDLRDAPSVELSWSRVDDVDAEEFARLRDLAARLATAGETCGAANDPPYAAVRRGEWSNAWQDDALESLEVFLRSIDPLEHAIPAACETLVPEARLRRRLALDDLAYLDEICALFLHEDPPPPPQLLGGDGEDYCADLDAWIVRGRARDRRREELRKSFRDEIVDLDLDALREDLERAETAWFGASWWKRRRVRRALAAVAVGYEKPSIEEARDALRQAAELRTEMTALMEVEIGATAVLGRLWQSGEADWDLLERLSQRATRLRRLALHAIGVDPDDDLAEGLRNAGELRRHWANLLDEGRELLRGDGVLAVRLGALRAAYANFDEARRDVVERFDLDEERAWPAHTKKATNLVRETVERWRSSAPRLREWCAWRLVRNQAADAGLEPLARAYEEGVCPGDLLPRACERSVFHWQLARITDAEPVLKTFLSSEHERKIDRFREVDERFLERTRELIQIRLTKRTPAAFAALAEGHPEILAGSELGILKREIGKKRRQMPVRRLLREIPNLLPRLKPCLLMSPMSAAQYLGGDRPPFDIVVFDEASQIPVWDAIGALGRARQAVIVGDPKQLPPTSFFHRADDEDEPLEEDVVEDLESILDDCIAAQIPRLSLDWHYRSRHESLIDFSNSRYYGGRLVTFPSPDRTGMGVSWRFVADGVYDKGRSRTNQAEAREVVAEVLRRLRAGTTNSIGVVTFSQAQQTLIEDLLDAERRADPKIDRWLGTDIEEPVFVKNLENVQGDERDVILFSICYGPDANGRVSMNFGPMNRQGGERRLNVAVTRARREVLVFSTLTADQIDLRRTKARGVADLKSFLEYAQQGDAGLQDESHDRAAQEAESLESKRFLEDDVRAALVARGWTVHAQVGCARERIDLAVVDPEAPERYLLGVLCDGPRYADAKTARDRDKLREAVLRGLGWTLHRIWALDWLRDPDRETEKLEEALRAAQAARNAPANPADDSEPQSAELPASRAPAPKRASSNKRNIDDISQKEICDAALFLLQLNLSVPRDDLARGISRRLGFARRGTKIAERVEQAIDEIVAVESARLSEDGSVVLNSPPDEG